VHEDWKRRIVESSSEDAVKVEFADEVFPPPSPGAYAVRPRALRTAFIDDGVGDKEAKRAELMTALAEGRAHELVPFTGQSAGGVHEVLPTAEIVRQFVEGAEAALREAS
jgi:nitronate monooxygenase/enoyl-[acyl-carrier protein] reductase II